MLNNHVLQRIALALLSCALLWLPEFIYSLRNTGYNGAGDVKSLAVVAIVLMATLQTSSRGLRVFVYLQLILYQAFQLAYYSYMGTYFSGFDIYLLADEMAEITESIGPVLPRVLKPFFLCITIGALNFYWINKKISTLPNTSKKTALAGTLIACCILALPFIQAATKKDSQVFQPNVNQSALKNGLYAWAFFSCKVLPSHLSHSTQHTAYQPYEIHAKAVAFPRHVILILGESFSSRRLSLFGFERDTTPLLSARAKRDANFIFSDSISVAVSTRVSLPLFMNLVYEPDNRKHLQGMSASLFKLAKQAGFTTHFVSNQHAGGLAYSFSKNDIDVWLDVDQLDAYPEHYDDRLLGYLKRAAIDWSQPQFIVLHQRNTHSPYISQYPPEQTLWPTTGLHYADFMRNSYDNAIRFNDQIIDGIFEFSQHIPHLPTLVVYTSDHGELLGEEGQFGHNAIDLQVARVPFLAYAHGTDIDNFGAIFRLTQGTACLTNHNQIGTALARELGMAVSNPNADYPYYHLNGVDVFGMAGSIRYNLEALGSHYYCHRNSTKKP